MLRQLRTPAHRFVWLVLCAAIAAAFGHRLLRAAAPPGPLSLSDTRGRVEVWPHVSVLVDPDRRLSIAEIPAAFDRFEAPTTSYGTLGVSAAAIWLRVPLEAARSSDGEWILDIDYAPIDVVDIYLLRDGRVEQQFPLGSMRPFASRPLRSRTHAVPLSLEPGTPYDLVLRLESRGTFILPITLDKPTGFHAAAMREQMLQGVLGGIGLCLLFYSLSQWVVLREPFFLKYSALITGSLLFSVVQFGIGLQYLWTDAFTFEGRAGGTAALMALVGSFLFVEQALDEPRTTPTFSRVMKGGAVGCAALGVLFQLGALPLPVITAVVSVLGPVPALMGIPGAVRMTRRGDPVGVALLLGWLVYFATTAVIIGVIGGVVPATFWTLHAFQIGATVDMVAFMYVLGLRTKAVRDAAQRARVERDLMRTLALTDPLTGLANRRGLTQELDGDRRNAADLLALYLIDADGFKAVNDHHGHDAGDELLVQISTRLRETVRSTDIVARLGGDEFVVLADRVGTAQAAEDLGAALLALADAPFVLAHQTVRIGLTVGYVLSPPAPRDPAALLKHADAAMYEGKRDGKRCLRRAPAVAPTGAVPASAT
ncbi:MAG: diguanylate cyclase [Vicinamibacterales bacterium]